VLLEVDTVRAAVAEPPLLIVTEDVPSEQLGAGVAVVVMLQARLTLPVYPFSEVALMAEVDVFPDVTGLGFSAEAVSV
jgi:hypothetical protein